MSPEIFGILGLQSRKSSALQYGRIIWQIFAFTFDMHISTTRAVIAL